MFLAFVVRPTDRPTDDAHRDDDDDDRDDDDDDGDDGRAVASAQGEAAREIFRECVRGRESRRPTATDGARGATDGGRARRARSGQRFAWRRRRR